MHTALRARRCETVVPSSSDNQLLQDGGATPCGLQSTLGSGFEKVGHASLLYSHVADQSGSITLHASY